MTPVAAPSSAPAPDFTLPDHTGRQVTLSQSLGPAATILIFYRGHWCPYCRRYLGKIKANYARFIERGAALLGISPEPPGTSAALAREMGIEFPLLSDIDCAVIDGYGVRNNFTGATPYLPHPAVFVLDPTRNIHFKSIDRNYKRRTPVPAVFRALDALRN